MSSQLQAPPTLSSRNDHDGDVSWLRPFDQLAVGDKHVSRARTITDTDLVRFAALAGDFTAHSRGHTLAMAVLPLTYSIGLVANYYIDALRRVLDLELERSPCAGETIHVEAEIEHLSVWTDEHGLVRGRWRIVNERQLGLVSVRLEAVWRRAPL